MDALNTFLGLISRTEGRDKFLRVIQYATLHSVEQQHKGSAGKVYDNIRMTRKVLRFLRTSECSAKIMAEWPSLMKSMQSLPLLLKHLTSILQNLFTALFYLSDHRVCLSELGVISKEHRTLHYPRSMMYYFLQNIMGVIHNIVSMAIAMQSSEKSSGLEETVKTVKAHSFDLIRCLLDCLVALFYWKNQLPAAKVGIIGVISSIMSIMQILHKA